MGTNTANQGPGYMLGRALTSGQNTGHTSWAQTQSDMTDWLAQCDTHLTTHTHTWSSKGHNETSTAGQKCASQQWVRRIEQSTSTNIQCWSKLSHSNGSKYRHHCHPYQPKTGTKVPCLGNGQAPSQEDGHIANRCRSTLLGTSVKLRQRKICSMKVE